MYVVMPFRSRSGSDPTEPSSCCHTRCAWSRQGSRQRGLVAARASTEKTLTHSQCWLVRVYRLMRSAWFSPGFPRLRQHIWGLLLRIALIYQHRRSQTKAGSSWYLGAPLRWDPSGNSRLCLDIVARLLSPSISRILLPGYGGVLSASGWGGPPSFGVANPPKQRNNESQSDASLS